MKNFHSDNWIKRKWQTFVLNKNGIKVDEKTGKIEYKNHKMEIKCDAVYLLRHARTYATQTHEFMSDNSKNSHICKEGIADICLLQREVKQYNFDIVILCSNIPRVLETGQIFKLVNPDLEYVDKKHFKGIDNGGWEGKTGKTLSEVDLKDFEEREQKQNIFAKSSKGGSWAKVLVNCLSLIKYLNKNFSGKRVLLISQGSILRGLKILTHKDENPWGDYKTEKLYNLDKMQSKSNYASINCLYDRKNDIK